MSLRFSNRADQRAKLMEHYRAAGEPERVLCRFLAISGDYRPEELPQFLVKSYASTPPDRSPGVDDWKRRIAECRKRGLVVMSHADIAINPLISMVCALDAVEARNRPVVEGLMGKWKQLHDQWHHSYYQNDGDIRRSVVLGTFSSSVLRDEPLNFFERESGLDLAELYNNPFDPVLLDKVEPPLLPLIFRAILRDSMSHGERADEACAHFARRITSGHDRDGYFRLLLGVHLLITGQFDAFATLSSSVKEMPLEVRAVERTMRGETTAALALFESALKAFRKHSRKSNYLFDGPSLPLYLICLIRSGDPKLRARAYKIAQRSPSSYRHPEPPWYPEQFRPLFDVNGLFLSGMTIGVRFATNPDDCIEAWLEMVVDWWLECDSTKIDFPGWHRSFHYAQSRGYDWIAYEMAEVLARFTDEKAYLDIAEQRRREWNVVSLADAVPRVEAWERALSTIADSIGGASRDQDVAATRLVWHVCLPQTQYSSLDINLYEQKRLKSGGWNRGRPLNVRGTPPANASEHDIRAISHLRSDPYHYGYGRSDPAPWEALNALVGHPAVYRAEDPNRRIEIVRQEPHLLVVSDKRGHRVSIDPAVTSADTLFHARFESDDRLIVTPIRPEHARIAALLGASGLRVPPYGKVKLLSVLNTIAPRIRIHADLDDVALASELVEPDSRPVVRMSGTGPGIVLEIWVRPIAGGRLFKPGQGPVAVGETVDERRVHSRRSFSSEKAAVRELLVACPSIENALDDTGDSACIDSPLECLEALSELKAAEPDVMVEWNERKPITLTPIPAGRLSVKIRSVDEWFQIDGELRVDENRVLTLQEIMSLLDSSQGRFVPLDDGRFLALTEEFRRQLERLRAFAGSANGKNGHRLHPLAALALQDLSEEFPEVDACDEWKLRVASMRKKLADDIPVPSTLQGELRDYQTAGFVWMARLAEMGAGACLADDMGLGKTVQTIALLLRRASQGPALVIAPTSVCPNWIEELARFAPTLDAQAFGESDRAACVNGAREGVVVVCSYGLLSSELELVTSKTWATVVLDEAQAIKNMTTQRSKAVMELNSGFRLVTTGTPLENHLGELWNIFRFINPGLLSSIEEFNRRFAAPIEQRDDQEARLRLKTLISPFILRRLKHQVLDELPPKTEKIIHVTLGTEEQALYEALRRNALSELADGTSQGKHLRILAQIMKLRRACCHPSLVMPDTAIPGSKLAAFGACVDELVDNKHRALVFSQFVDHLTIVRAWCDERKITYQYLDGSTPARDRAERIRAFQSGEGTLFLMSLKAGGIGVNLTGADFVILLDPWWNPAVEDQAAARAHRIGQQRPVTIYRLIAKGTIEEKIVDLHKHKRALAESLLEGGELSGTMSAEELMNLIKDSAVE